MDTNDFQNEPLQQYDKHSIEQMVFFKFKEFVLDFIKSYGTKLFDSQSVTMGILIQTSVKFSASLISIDHPQYKAFQSNVLDLFNFLNCPVEYFIEHFSEMINLYFNLEEQISLLKFLDVFHADVVINKFNNISRRLVDFKFNILTDEQYRRYNAKNINNKITIVNNNMYNFENKRFFNIIAPSMLKNFESLAMLGRVKLDASYLNSLSPSLEDDDLNYNDKKRKKRRKTSIKCNDSNNEFNAQQAEDEHYKEMVRLYRESNNRVVVNILTGGSDNSSLISENFLDENKSEIDNDVIDENHIFNYSGEDESYDKLTRRSVFILYWTKLITYFPNFVNHLNHVCKISQKSSLKCQSAIAGISTAPPDCIGALLRGTNINSITGTQQFPDKVKHRTYKNRDFFNSSIISNGEMSFGERVEKINIDGERRRLNLESRAFGGTKEYDDDEMSDSMSFIGEYNLYRDRRTSSSVSFKRPFDVIT